MRKLFLLVGFIFFCLGAAAQEVVVRGVVRDRVSMKELENVTVTLVGTSVGTVTNADGVFSLKIPSGTSAGQLDFSHIGYINARYPAAESADAVIMMMPVARVLDEAVVYGDARGIVEEALRRVPANYSPSDNMLNTFYRETIQKNSRYIGISEAMMDVYKTDYSERTASFDKVQITKARRLMSQKRGDTLSVKVADGPNLSMGLDIVKNPDVLFDEETMDYYDFVQEPSVVMDNRIQFVISFEPRAVVGYALLSGRLFIDSERLSFTRAEFSLDLSDTDKAVASILHKKPAGLLFRPLEVNFLVSYREHGGISYMNYICNEIRFKCDWKKRLFSSTYTARSEMVVVDIDTAPDRTITGRDSFKTGQIFYDIVKEYWHEDFWKDYNIIEPTETLENAVRRLRK